MFDARRWLPSIRPWDRDSFTRISYVGREEYDKEKGKGTCNLADIPGKIGVEVSGTFHKKLGKVLQLRGHNEEN